MSLFIGTESVCADGSLALAQWIIQTPIKHLSLPLSSRGKEVAAVASPLDMLGDLIAQQIGRRDCTNKDW
jgi:hypothetical protein